MDQQNNKMKKIIYVVLRQCFGKRQFYRFFLILKNLGLEGLNYRNSEIKTNGEFFLLREIANYYRNEKKIILFDVGANVGNYSKNLADLFKDSAIYSFEPFSTAYHKLKELSLTHSNILPQKIGLSAKNGELPVYSNDVFSEIGGVYNRSAILKNISLDKNEICEFRTITSFCSDNHISHIHFLKIDTEGHELEVLKGAIDFLENGKTDFIQFEFGSGNIFSRTYFWDLYNLLKQDYVICRLLKNGFIRINEYDSDLEMQILTNFVAVNKRHEADFFLNRK
jgi:FkbM family methyltransferase